MFRAVCAAADRCAVPFLERRQTCPRICRQTCPRICSQICRRVFRRNGRGQSTNVHASARQSRREVWRFSRYPLSRAVYASARPRRQVAARGSGTRVPGKRQPRDDRLVRRRPDVPPVVRQSVRIVARRADPADVRRGKLCPPLDHRVPDVPVLARPSPGGCLVGCPCGCPGGYLGGCLGARPVACPGACRLRRPRAVAAAVASP